MRGAQGPSGDRGDAAVSSVVGTVLMLGVTLSAFAGLSYFVLLQFQGEADAPRADLAVAREGSSLLLLQQGGEPVPLTGASILTNIGGSERETAVADMPGAAALGPTLELGEALCIQGSDTARCLYAPAFDIRAVVLLADGFLLAQVGPRGDPTLPVPFPPDLTISALSWTPTAPVAPEAVSISASLTNLGGPTPAVPVTVAFRIDGTLIGTVQVTGPFAGGSTAVVSAPAWTSTPGSHTVTATADPGWAITETSETNNARSGAFTVEPGVPDPGFPYADANGDGYYTVGTDTAVASAEVTDGQYDCPAGKGLTIPPSVGAISAPTIDLACDGAIILRVGLTTTTGTLLVEAGGKIELASGLTASSAGSLTFAPRGALLANGTTLTSATALTLGDPSSARAGTDFFLNGATVDNTLGSGDLTVQLLGSLDLTGATLLSRGDIALGGYNAGSPAQSIVLSGAVLDATAGTGDVVLQDLAGSVTGEGSATRLLSKGTIEVQAALDVGFGQATLDNSGGSSAITVTGRSLSFAGSVLRTNGAVQVTGSGTTSCGGCSVTAGGDVTLTGQGGTMDVRGATLSTAGNRDLKLTVGTGQQVLVDAATFDDRNDRADVTPNGAAVGTPLSGGVE